MINKSQIEFIELLSLRSLTWSIMASTLPLSALFHLQADVAERLFASRAQHVLAITYMLNQGSAVRACTGVRHYDLIYFLRSAVLKDSIYSII